MSVPEVPGPPNRSVAARFLYKAFISYSHASDGHLAGFLQAALQGFAKAWYRRRSIRVFRDTTGLDVTPDLWTSIRKALEASEYFILLASERAAQSRWIELELDTWLRVAAPDRVLIVWTDGDLAWDAAAGDFDWQRSTCLPPRLRGVFRAEPLHVDLRWARKGEDLSLRRPEFVDAVARISATLRQLPLDDLLGEDVRQHRRTRRLAGAAVATLGVLLISAVTAASFAYQQRNAARRSLVDVMVANGVKEIDASDLSAAALWFVEALRLGEGQTREDLQRIRLRAAVRTHPAVQQVWFTDPKLEHRGAVFGRDDRYVVSRAMRGQIEWTDGRVKVTPAPIDGPRVWDAQSGDSVSLTFPSASTEHALAVDAVSGRVRVLTAGTGGPARLLDARSGEEIMRFDHPGEVAAADFAQDGSVVLTESYDDAVRVWDAADGRLLESIQHESTLISAGLTADGRAVLSTTADGAAHVWHLDAHSEKSRHIKLEHDDAVEQIDLSKDGRYVTTLANRTARLWELSSGDPPSLLRSWIGVNHAEFSPNGAVLLMADVFGEASLFGLDALQPLVVVRHGGPVLHATFSSDGAQFATAGTDRIARVWNASSGAPLSPLLYHEQTVTHVAFDGEQTRLATTTTEGVVRVWNLGGRPPALRHESVRRAEFHPDGRRLLTVSFEEIKLWDLNGAPPLTLSVGSQIYHAAFSPDGRRIVSTSEDGQARIWDATTGAEVRALRHERRVHHASFRPDGTWLATAGAAGVSDAEVSVWDAATGKKLFSLPHRSERPDRAEFSPDGSKLLTSGAGTAGIWNLATRQRLDAFRFDDDVTTPSFSPDGSLVVVVSGRSSVKVYDVARASPVGRAIQHENYRIDHVEFGADSETLLIAGGGYARVWDVRRGVPMTPPLTHGSGTVVGYAVTSDDGQFLATAAGSDGTARVWHAQTGQALTPPLVHGSGLREVAFSPDGSQVVTSGGDTVRVWPLSNGASLNDQHLGLSARVLAARQIDATGGIVSLDVAQFREAWEAAQQASLRPRP